MSNIIKPFVEVQPGQIYRAKSKLTGENVLFLKLRDQKAVNLNTYISFRCELQHELVEITDLCLDFIQR